MRCPRGSARRRGFLRAERPRITAKGLWLTDRLQPRDPTRPRMSLSPWPRVPHLRAPSRITCRVRAAGVPPGFPHGLGHGLDHVRCQRGGCVIVHVNLPEGQKTERCLMEDELRHRNSCTCHVDRRRGRRGQGPPLQSSFQPLGAPVVHPPGLRSDPSRPGSRGPRGVPEGAPSQLALWPSRPCLCFPWFL